MAENGGSNLISIVKTVDFAKLLQIMFFLALVTNGNSKSLNDEVSQSSGTITEFRGST